MYLKNSKVIVVKIGSSLLVDNKKKIRKKWLQSFAWDIQKLRLKNKKIIIVSSGAIALGCKKMNYNKVDLKLDKSQAVASIGQIELMNLFSQTFSEFRLNISQILLTLDDTEERRRSINAKRTLENLFKINYIPIVNENDRLASRVAQISNADTLILLSDVDGLFTKNPKKYKNAELIKEVRDLKKDIKNINLKGMTKLGSGGMNTKIEAAKICNLAWCNMVIANGLKLNPITQIQKKNNCTWFLSKVTKLHARKKWIISSVSPKGELIIDEGAKKALINGKSLLAAGIKKVSGIFKKGDHIKILDNKKKEFARGLSSFSSDEINKIIGCHSNEIQNILGYISKSEVVHKDDMVEIWWKIY